MRLRRIVVGERGIWIVFFSHVRIIPGPQSHFYPLKD